MTKNDTVLYQGVEVKVLKINPEFQGNRTAIIDINGQSRTVAYASLKPTKNKFTSKKSDAEKHKDVLVDVQRLHEGYKYDINYIEQKEYPTDKELMQRILFMKFSEELQAILTGKKLEA